MIGEQIEERKLFSYEERKEILKENYGICACCGKKLTTKTMTVEHVIPLVRGGTNDRENLTVLCYDCNQLKGSLVYMPVGFYAALRDKPRFHQMQKLLQDWFIGIKQDFDLMRYPLIAPRFYIQIEASEKPKSRKKTPFIRQLALEYRLINRDYYEEIEAVTDISIRETKNTLRYYVEEKDETHPIAMYSVRKLTSDKILAVIAVYYDPETKRFAVYIPWHSMSKGFLASITYNFVLNILTSLTTVAKEEIREYFIFSEYKECMEYATTLVKTGHGQAVECYYYANSKKKVPELYVARIEYRNANKEAKYAMRKQHSEGLV